MSPKKLLAFTKAEEIAYKKTDHRLWLQGGYFYDALMAGLSNFGAGLNGKNGNASYTDEPYSNKQPRTPEEERKRAIEYFASLVK